MMGRVQLSQHPPMLHADKVVLLKVKINVDMTNCP